MSWLPDWLTGYDAENAQRAADADARLRELNKQAHDAGIYSDEAYAQVLDNYDNKQVPFGVDAQREDIQQTFNDELDNRAKGIFGTPLGAIADVLRSILKAIPLWVWLLAGVALFVWLGGGRWLERKARSKLAT